MSNGAAIAELDEGEELAERVARARIDGRPLAIRGGGSKTGLIGEAVEGDLLDVGAHSGVIDYSPAELVVTVRAGTPVAGLNALLATEGQRLASEPPAFDGRATVGGTLACNLSGPARPWAGSLRDAVLGVGLIDGRGRRLNFGGQVMKNVAGYDVSRLQAGALGTLGVITEVSLKVMPQPETSTTLARAMSLEEAIATMNTRAGQPGPLTGAAYVNGRLFLRLAGAADAVAHTAGRWGGERVADADCPWHGLQECKPPGAGPVGDLWRISVGATAPAEHAPCAIDWCGGLRWYSGEVDGNALHAHAQAHGGYALRFRGEHTGGQARSPLAPSAQRLHQRLKQAFDPDHVLNPGRLYGWL
jgi:glycolate oxidase FAD binding subunit